MVNGDSLSKLLAWVPIVAVVAGVYGGYITFATIATIQTNVVELKEELAETRHERNDLRADIAEARRIAGEANNAAAINLQGLKMAGGRLNSMEARIR